MSSTFFTTNDGDVILRAGLEPDSKHDFRVHKLILSLASPVFKDMFAFPQPPTQNQTEEHQLPTVDIPDPPPVLDTILRLIYPGVELPRISDLLTLSAVLSAADKYNIASIYPILRDSLKTFLPGSSFGVYVIACRFGFMEEAKAAAKVGSPQNIISRDLDEEVRHISSTDLLRWVRFVQEREKQCRLQIESLFESWDLEWDCMHDEVSKDFYFHLEKVVVDAFSRNPCVGSYDLYAVLDKVPDPPPGCEPPLNAGEFYREHADGRFDCPLLPMTIRNNLALVAKKVDDVTRVMLDKTFGEGIGSG